MPVFAHEFKGADEFVLGGIATANAIVPLLASIPLGRLADRYGRKKMLFIIAPLTYAANLCLIFAPTSGLGSISVLLLFGVLFGFNTIGVGLASSMAAEIVPKEQMGRWVGMISLFRGMLSIPAPIIGGLIWEHIGPHYIFVAAIAVDLFLRLPILAMVKETLHINRVELLNS
jgi:DHA1 family bicyclomycin/chloramphenicol resistance-like MFS transporter